MTLYASVNLDIWNLLCHDSDKAWHPFDNDQLAAAINRRLEELNATEGVEYDKVRALPPAETGVDRLIISWQPWGQTPTTIAKRYRHPTDIRSHIPPKIAKWLDKINDEGITLSEPI